MTNTDRKEHALHCGRVCSAIVGDPILPCDCGFGGDSRPHPAELLHDAWAMDLEFGVAWINEFKAAEFKSRYPSLWNAMVEIFLADEGADGPDPNIPKE